MRTVYAMCHVVTFDPHSCIIGWNLVLIIIIIKLKIIILFLVVGSCKLILAMPLSTFR